MPCRQGFDREREAEVGFPDSWWPKKHHVGSRLDKRQISQFPQQPFRETRLEGEVKGLQGLDGGQTSCCHSSFRCSSIPPLNLGRNGTVEKRLIGPLFLSSCLKELRQGLLQLR